MSKEQKIGTSLANYYKDFSAVLAKKIERNGGILYIFVTSFRNEPLQ
jgi:hypothetical protein